MRNLPQASSRVTSISRRKLYLAMLTATQFMAAGQVWAGPEGGQVVGGAGSIKQSGTETVINQQTDRMAIDWQSFDVKVDERVQFIQPNSSSVALNRVLSNKGSEILGRVDANGHVFLVNPNGVVFGKDSHINVGGILASGMSIDPTEFMNGNFTLNSIEGTEGKVINSGIINAATGGSVTLLGKEVKNEGLIVANLGAVNLAAGKEAVVTFDSSGLVGVKVTKAILQNELGVDAAVLNTGEINAQGGRILLTASTSQDIFSQAVNHGELSAAASAVVNADGSFTLGGGADVVNTGSLNVSSTNGDAGQIVALGNNVTNSGNISANTQNGKAGHIELNSIDTTQLIQNSTVSAQATASGKGGDIKILGNKVGAFDSASINASGTNGGGQVLFGGDQTGKNKLVNNANFIYLGENTSAKTDALLNGNGGKLITFAQDTAIIYGNLSARGGNESGNGGFIETSGLKGFEILKTPDISAKNGVGGSWLIDPYDLTITTSGTITGAPFDSSSGASMLDVATLLAAMTNGSVVTVSTGTGGAPGVGDITLDTNLVYNDTKSAPGAYNHSSAKSTLILNAANDIKINANISQANSATGNLSLQLNANNGSEKSGTGSVIVASGKKIETAGGSFTATGTDFTLNASGNTTNSISTNGGDVSLAMTGAVTLGNKNTIATNGGSFTVGSSSNRATSFLSTNGKIDTTSGAKGGDVNIYTTSNVDLGSVSFGGTTQTSNATVGNVTIDSSAGNISLTGDYFYYSDTKLGADPTVKLTAQRSDDVNFGKITISNVNIDNTSDGVYKLNLDFNAGRNITIDNTSNPNNNEGFWLKGGSAKITSALGDILITNSTSNGSAALDSEGGDITLVTTGAVTIKGNGVNTKGGKFTVGQLASNSPVLPEIKVASFTNYGAGNTVAKINTSSDSGGGNILINSAGDVALGDLSFKDSNVGSQTKTGTVKVISGGSVTVNKDIDFVDVGTGSFLDISAAKDIGIKANILNSDSTPPADKFNVLLKANTASSTTEGDITIDSGKKIETHGGSFFAQGRNFTTSSNTTTLISTANDTAATVGGNVDLDMTGAVSIKAPIKTGGGNFTVGTFNGNAVDHRAASFDASDNNAKIDTFNAFGGGDIYINTINDIALGNMTFGYSAVNAGGATNNLLRVGSIEVDSSLGSVTLTKDIQYNDSAKRTDTGTDNASITSDAHLSIKAGNNITITGSIYDAVGDARDSLDVTLVSTGATGAINIDNNIYTAGGNFSATANSFDSTGFIIDTDNAKAGANSTRSNGGDITLNASSSITLGDLITDANSNPSFGTRTGNLTISGIAKDADGISTDSVTVTQASNTNTINVAGATIFNLGNGDLILGSGVSPFTFNSNTFSGVVSITSARKVKLKNTAATTLGKSNISNDFDLVSGGDVSDTNTATDSVIVGGTTTINALNHVVTLDNNNDFNTVNFSGNITSLALNDVNALILGNTTTSGGAISASTASGVLTTGTLTTNNSSGAAGNITLTGVGGILLNGNLSAKSTAGNGGIVDLKNNVQLNNVAIDTSGSSARGDIKFEGMLDSSNSTTRDLTLTGKAVTFAGNVGGTNRLGALTINASGDVNSSGSTTNFTLASLNVASANNFYSSSITTADTVNDKDGGSVSITGTNAVSTGDISTNASATTSGNNGKKGGVVTINGNAISTGILNSSGADAAGNIGGNGGNISITAKATTNNGTESISVKDINANKGIGLTSGTDGTAILILNENSKTGTSGTVSFITSNFITSNVSVVGSASTTDTLNGIGVDSTWTINGSNTIAATANPSGAKINFSSIENFVGGSAIDIFNITAAFTGNIKGGNGDNIFNIGANATKVEGGTGNDTFNITTTGALTAVLDGGTGTDTLVGSNRTNNWTLGTAESLNTTLTFSNIENITGNAGVDTFTFIGARNPAGIIDAKGGVDIINVATDATIDYTGAFSLFGVANAEVINSQGGGILTAKSNSNQNVTWTIANAGNKVTDGTNEIQFTNFATLTGGNGNDIFNISVAFVGNIKGGNGDNIFNIGADVSNKVEGGTGNDTFNITTIGALTAVLDGGTGTDTLVGANRTNDWMLGTAESLNSTLTFSNIENITGNANVDTFTFIGARSLSGIIDAKGGVDIINVATDATIDYTGTFSLFGVSNAEVVHSQAGGILTAKSNSNQNITWTIANAGNNVTDGTNEVQFTNFATLVGGNGNDTFNVTDTAKVSGLIDGKAGTNILDLNSATGAYKVEVASVVGVADLTVNNMSTIIGNDNANSALIKNSGNNTWKVFDFDGASNIADGINDGTLGTISFINFKNLVAGSGNDTFDFSDVASGSITGKIDGGTGTNSIKARGTGANTWSMTGNNSGSLAVTINLPTTYINEFANIQTFSGSGTDTMSFAAITTDDVKVELGNASSGASGITNFIGNNKDHSEIVGANTTNTWTIKSTGINDVGGISFSNFKLLTGNASVDNFIIESGAAFNGTINGGAGTAQNSLTSQDAGGEWTLDSATARKGTLNTKSFLNIDEIKGSGTDSLTGRDQNNDWTIAGANSGDVHLAGASNTADKIIFSGIANLKGLTGVDTFTLEVAGSLSGIIDGGSAGANNILINKHSNAIWLLDAVTALKGTLDGKTFQNINEIQGSGSDKLTGRNQANDWTITGTNSGDVHLAGANTADKITFKGITDLTGGTGKDTFSLEATGSLSGIIDGGDIGSNILINKRANATWVLDTSTAFKGTLNTKIFQNINEIQGSGSDSLTGRNQDNDWSITGANEGNVHLAGATNTADKIIFKGMSDLSGLAGTDTFTLESAGSLSGVIDGGDAGDNILVNKHSGATWLLDAVTAHKGTLDNKTFLNINEIQGSGTDSITGRNQANDWTITGLNSGNVHLAGDTNTADQITFSGVNSLIGNIEVDKFTFNANFIGDVKGGGKNDEFYINAKVTNISGEAGDDKFIFSSSGGVTLIDGGTGTANTIISPADLESSWVLTGANAGTLKSITNVSYVNSFQSIQVLQGSQLDSLTGRAQANKWTITDVNSGTLKEDIATPLDSIKFTGMKNLIGSTGADYFDFSTSATSEVKGKVDGGDANNNTIKARVTSNTWTMTDNTTGQLKVTNGAVYIPSFLNIQTRIGSGTDTIVSDFWDLRNNSQGVTSIQGSNSLTSILIGFDAVNNWEITALNTGTITDTGTQKAVSFEGFNNLAGGNKSDTFKFIEGGSIGGVVKGAADGVTEQADVVNSIKGINAINTWQMTGTNSGTVTSSTDSKPYAIFSNIQKLFGGSKADLLIGSTDISNTAQTWKLGAENSLVLNQNSNAIKFSDIEEVRGGAGVNTVINELADMSWLLTGANQGSINSIAFSNIGVIQGSGTDSLTGRNQDNSWRVKSADSGEVSQSNSTDDNIKFSKIKNLIGGTGKDTFTLVAESGLTGSISGSINGGATANDTFNTLISQADSNIWSLDGKNTSVNGVKFVNISGVVGSAGVDIFNITNLDTLKLLMDGAGGANDKVDLTALGAGKNVSIGVGASIATDLRITNIEIVNANNSNNNTVIADNTSAGNEWSITGLNIGTLNKNALNNGVSFNGFANLVGGTTADNFVFTKGGMISGLIDGNSSADMNSVLDTLDLTNFDAPVSVAIGGTDPGVIHVSNIENIKANASVSNKLIGGNNLSYTWSLTDINSGTVAPTTVAPALPLKETITAFSGFAQLQGGNNVDYFQISDAWNGAVDGGDGKDFVDYSSRKAAFTTIVGGTGNNSVTNVEAFVGNGTNSTIAVADGTNTWTLGKIGIDGDTRDDGVNDGQIFIGNSSQTVYFINFNNITGGTGDDTFNINSGELTGSIFGGKGNDTFKQTAGIVRGTIYGGEGNDTLIVTLGDTPADKTTFNDNEGTNTINVKGGNANYVAKHSSETAAGGSLSYEANNKTQTIDYLGNFNINDDVVADRLELSGTTNVVDTFSLTTNSYSLNKLTTINYKNKDNLKIAGEAGDSVEINGVLNIPKILTIQNASLVEGDNGVINAEGLRLDGTAAVGSLDKRVKTNIANLYLSSTLGETYLQEENSLNLTSFNTDSLFDLTLAGNLTRGAAIASTGVFNINSGTGDIKLDKADGFDANRLTGGLGLNSSGNVVLSNSGATTLNSVHAQNLNITATDAINAKGDINVIGLASFDTAGNLTATSPTNNFNSIVVLNAANVDLVNKGKLSVQGINASGNIATQSQGINITGAIAGANVDIKTGSEKAILGSSMQVNNLSVNAGSIDVNAALMASSIDLNGQDGLVKLDGALNTSGKQNVNVVAGQIIQSAKITSGGNTTLTASGDLSQKADIESGADILVNAGGNFNLDAGKASKGNKIEYLVQGVANFLGNITANTGIHIGGKKEVTQSALLSSADGDIKIDADKLTMSNDAVTTATKGSVAVNTSGDIAASAFNAENGAVIFTTSAGKVIDVNGDKVNVVAKKLQVDSELGIGNLTDALETTVSELSLSNNGVNGGIVNVQNNAAVNISRLRSNGDVIFTNLTGDVVLDNSQLAPYDKAATDARLAGGPMNSNYNIGLLTVNIANGDLLATGVPSLERPDITARAIVINAPLSSIGSKARPLVIYVNKKLEANALKLYQPYWGFNDKPDVVTGAKPISTSLSTDAGQLVQVETIDEVNPAIFTGVRNYVYDDIAILLPLDQRYGDKDTEE